MLEVRTFKMSEWIVVEDRLPPQDVYVFIVRYDSRPNVHMQSVEIASRFGNMWFDGKDGSEVTEKGKYGRVTHWMPLPEPPKEKSDG